MRKVFMSIFLVVSVICCFVGCVHYEQEDADRITEKGTKMMHDWLDEHMPNAEMKECSAFVQNIKYSSQEYLTDYATGQIQLNGDEYVFAIDTVTGAVYFENEQSEAEKLDEIAAAYLYDTMEIMPEGSDDYFDCYVLAPFRDEGHKLKAYQLDYGFDFGLPAGIEDLQSFVRESESRPLLYVRTQITLPDNTDLSAYDLEVIERLSDECGMLFGSIGIESGNKVFKSSIQEWMTEAEFYEYDNWIKRDGVELYGRVCVREEERNDLTKEETVTERRFEPDQDLVFEETATGYRYYLPNKDWQEVFNIYADKGSAMLEYDYIQYYYSNVDGYIDGNYNSNEMEGTETVWIMQSDGSYVLSSKANKLPINFSQAGELERIQ